MPQDLSLLSIDGYLYETALREGCGYTGYQPYWDWARGIDMPPSTNPRLMVL